MAIDSKHPQYIDNESKWKLIDDIIEENNLTDYLIELNSHDTSNENKARNAMYKERAVFYALAGQTASGMIGTVFSKNPLLVVPEGLSYIEGNIDGSGNSIHQQSRKAVLNTTTKSRAGLFTSFPETDGEISKEDVTSGKFVASINLITPQRIINWNTSTIGAKTFLSLVVFEDSKVELVDYEHKTVDILRELYIDDGIYKERHWIKAEEKWVVDEVGERIPKGHSGKPLTEIPFTFIGSENNDYCVDKPIMHAMCSLNVSHYRNSADFEDSVWFAGQAQPWMSAVDQDHIDLMKANHMYVGSRETLAVPEDGQFGFASAPPNPLVRQAMLDKVDMMIGIGARMITPGGVAKTAEQSSNERETQHSMLSMVVENVNEAYESCLKWAAIYMGATGEISYEINTDFVKASATPAELKEVISGYIVGAIPAYDFTLYMKKYGIFDDEKSAADYASEISLPSGVPEG